MKLLRSVIVLIICLIIAVPARSQLSSAADFLREITVRINIQNIATKATGLCHGFAHSSRAFTTFVATAKHCFASTFVEFTPFISNRPRIWNVPPRLLNVAMTVESPEGNSPVSSVVWNSIGDVLVLKTAYTGAAWGTRCPSCQVYRHFGTNRQIPVVSMLSVAGSQPLPSSGVVISGQDGTYWVVLPNSPGTSGSAVLDMKGNLVGIVVTVEVMQGTQAGWKSGIVLGSVVDALVAEARR